MRTNEEFKQLVNDKYKKLKAAKKRKTKIVCSLASSFLICLLVCTVFIGNGMFKRIFSEYGTGSPFEDTQYTSSSLNEQSKSVESAQDTYYSEEIGDNSSVFDFFESAEQNEADTSEGLPEATVSEMSEVVAEGEIVAPECSLESSCDEFYDKNSSCNDMESGFVQEDCSENEIVSEETTHTDKRTRQHFSFLLIKYEIK